MTNQELTKNDINRLLFASKVIGQGSYGVLVEYDDNTLLKIYYKDIIDTYLSKDIEKLDEEISMCSDVEKEMVEMGILEETRLEKLLSHIKQLKATKSGELIKGIATYKGWGIGVFLENYKEYDKLTEIFDKLNNEEKKKVFVSAGELLGELFKNGIFPSDLKEDNILVRKRDLDTKLIDLDGDDTRYEDKEYIKEFPYIKRNVVIAFENMKKRLERNNSQER